MINSLDDVPNDGQFLADENLFERPIGTENNKLPSFSVQFIFRASFSDQYVIKRLSINYFQW